MAVMAVMAVMAAGVAIGGESPCVEVVPNDEVHCPYHAVPAGDNVLFLDLDDGAIRSASSDRPDEPSGHVVLDPFFELGWTPGPATVSPDGERLLVARTKPSCPGWTGAPGPGLPCSYGRPTLWLAQHATRDVADPTDDLWVHINLTRRLLGRNSEIHGWTTWVHRDLALFNAVVFPDDGGWYQRQEENAAQIYAVGFAGPGIVTIQPYAPAQLWRTDCLTGRVSAQPPREGDRCFAGQRVSFVRRCYDEPNLDHGWAWSNTRRNDGTGGPCRLDRTAMQVPVLRVYVVELDDTCAPTRAFEEIEPVRDPPDGPFNRQMGVVPEWGDMLAGISPDGEWVAFATNTGDPAGDGDDNCAGFTIDLSDPGDPLSGQSLRWTHVCRLAGDLTCEAEASAIGVEFAAPPESTPLPSFLGGSFLSGAGLVYSRSRRHAVEPAVLDVMRLDLWRGPEARVPLVFGRHATAITPIVRVPLPPRPPRLRLGESSAAGE
jgi:hypothetical protein